MNKLNDSPIGADFDDFSYRSDRCEMGKLRGTHPEGGTAFTKLIYHARALTLVEEWTDSSAENFQERFVKILEVWLKEFPNTSAISQNCCLRALVQPMYFKDSRTFLGDHILRIGSHIKEAFTKMPYRIGFTIGCSQEVEHNQLFIDTTVNSWRDNRTVWLEVNGNSALAQPINATNTSNAGQPFQACKSFLENEVMDLLRKFDVAGGGGPDT